jgi:iron(III) transport system ATP-binding protein
VQQFASAYDLDHEPASYFVANFIGEGTFIEGVTLKRNNDWFAQTAIGLMRLSNDEDSHFKQHPKSYENTQTVRILLRPDDVIHDDTSPTKAIIEERHFRGAFIRYQLRLPESNETVLCFAPSHHNHEIGETFGIRAEVEHVICF